MGCPWNQEKEGAEDAVTASGRRNKVFSENLTELRKINHLTQEDIAEKVGVSRQSVAKWESGETVPDLDKCKILADIFSVSLDDLANYDIKNELGLGMPPKGKHLFGIVKVGDKGQIVIPAKAREVFDIKAGERLVVLGDEGMGIAIAKADDFIKMANMVKKDM
ncbi:MAG: helix-turn-helix domain-containing protein [Lachnospiraceae bacterium]|nr:helix-turn-helix domain-containing protein [Lachnospiraceae bacterium]